MTSTYQGTFITAALFVVAFANVTPSSDPKQAGRPDDVCVIKGARYFNSSLGECLPCVSTCGKPFPVCDISECMSGCGCPFGKVYDAERNTCISLSKCKHTLECVLENGDVLKEDESTTFYTNSTNKCTTCTCVGGKLICAALTCPILSCPPKNRTPPQGECCPICDIEEVIITEPVPVVCFAGEDLLFPGDSYRPDPCTECTCVDGHLRCTSNQCDITICRYGDIVTTPPGQCCPICQRQNSKCFYHTKNDVFIVENGHSIKDTPCTNCTCKDGNMNCRSLSCGHLDCSSDEEIHYPPDQCCPICRVLN